MGSSATNGRVRSNLIPSEIIETQNLFEAPAIITSHAGFNIKSAKTVISRADQVSMVSHLQPFWKRLEQSTKKKGTYVPRSKPGKHSRLAAVLMSVMCYEAHKGTSRRAIAKRLIDTPEQKECVICCGLASPGGRDLTRCCLRPLCGDCADDEERAIMKGDTRPCFECCLDDCPSP